MSGLPNTERVNPISERLDSAPLPVFLEAMLADQSMVATAVRLALPDIAGLAEDIVRVYAAGGRIVFTGSGTSGRLAALEAAECPPTFGTDPERILAIIAGGPGAMLRSAEGAEDDAAAGSAAIVSLDIASEDLVIGVSASGATPFVRGTLLEATRRGATTAVIVCNSGTALALLAKRAIMLDTGAEFVAGSTRLKAGSAQKLALNLATTGAMRQLGRVLAGRMIAVLATNSKLRARAIRIIQDLIGAEELQATDLLDAAGGDLFAVLAATSAPAHASSPADADVVFRPLGDADVPALLELADKPAIVATTAPFSQLGGDALFRAWLARPGLMLGAFVEGCLAGVALVEARGALLREHVADITYVAVDPAFGRQGIGAQIVQRVLVWAAAAGLNRVELRVWPDNDRALRLYSRLGFEIEGRMRGHAIVQGRVYDALLLAWVDPRLVAARGEREEGHA